MLDLLTGQNEITQTTLSDQLEGHRLQDEITSLPLRQLADFCRHIGMANKGIIGWEQVDSIFERLSKEYTAAWKLPNLGFQKGFQQLFSTIAKFNLSAGNQEYVLNILATLGNKNVDVETKLKSGRHLLNFKDIDFLFEALVNYLNTHKDSDTSAQLAAIVSTLSQFFQKEIKDRTHSKHRQVALTLLYVKSFAHMGEENVQKSQEYLDQAWRMVQKMTEQEILSYRYVFGAAYTMIEHHILETTSDFVVNRRLLGNLLDNFVNPEGVKLVEWLDYIADMPVEPYILSYILHGYKNLIPILHSQANALPHSETHLNLIETLQQVTLQLRKLAFSILYAKYDLPKNINLESPDLLSEVNRLIIPYLLKQRIMSIIILTTQTDIHQEFTKIEDMKTVLKNLYELQVYTTSEGIAQFMKIDLELKTNNYPFQTLFSNINYESSEHKSIILSATFENMVIQQLSLFMQHLFEEAERTGSIDISNYETVLNFASQWLKIFKQSQDLYNEALMVLSPIISICYVQQAKGYYEKQQTVKAFLTYLNMHYFLELFVDEINRSDTWGVIGGSDTNQPHQTNKYEKLIDEWNIQQFLNISDLQQVANALELSLKVVDDSESGQSSFSGMIDDEILFGYMDATGYLQSFIELMKITAGGEDVSVADKIQASDLFRAQNQQSEVVVIQPDQNIDDKGLVEMPFPILNNIELMTVGLQIFPIEFDLPNILSDNDKIYETFKNRFTVE